MTERIAAVIRECGLSDLSLPPSVEESGKKSARDSVVASDSARTAGKEEASVGEDQRPPNRGEDASAGDDRCDIDDRGDIDLRLDVDLRADVVDALGVVDNHGDVDLRADVVNLRGVLEAFPPPSAAVVVASSTRDKPEVGIAVGGSSRPTEDVDLRDCAR